ncbi:hypothetical protein Q5P01_010636 [Channa striata]|uniref:Uncharacterized protein n=1 Tax=Channa striata TaxID=64152 RepID=A0AA88MXA5_CHASR|nr:hypothetical protein Q5P01_010636 [Channa striata]
MKAAITKAENASADNSSHSFAVSNPIWQKSSDTEAFRSGDILSFSCSHTWGPKFQLVFHRAKQLWDRFTSVRLHGCFADHRILSWWAGV